MAKQPQGTVLYVDDDETNRRILSYFFREAGFEVREAATGGEALLLAAEKPDLVVLDVQLPDINGFEVCRRIRRDPAITGIPILHVSAVHISHEDRALALEEGADAYLTKPVEPRELVAQARALLRVRRAEEEARAAARQWQATFAAIKDGVCLLDRDGRVLRCNPALAAILGKSPAEILGRPCQELTPGAPAFARMAQTLQRETAEMVLGERRLHLVADPMLVEDSSLAGAVYVVTDVTERQRLEERLRQAQKMEALGQLAGGVAHDFNNLLTAVTGNVSLLLLGKEEQDPDRELLLAVEQAAWRGAELARRLLGISRQATPRLQPVHLRASLDEIIGLLRRTFDPRIRVEIRTAGDLWSVQADPGQIHQVLMNLCINSRDAMPEGGQLLLEAENAGRDERAGPTAREPRPGEFVRLRVRDSGLGIAPEALPHVFEPFFTTKKKEGGTGLGLATVYGIVRQHGGWVECASTAGQGTCVDVYLPRSAEGAPGVPAQPAVRPSERLAQGTETLLLAEDDDDLRALGAHLLRRAGYTVLMARDGQEAVEVYQRERARIALVILDLVMPRLSGQDALRELLRLDPGVRVVVCSGQAEEEAGPGLAGALGFLAKPYRDQDLPLAVRRVLDRGLAGVGGLPAGLEDSTRQSHSGGSV